MLILIERKLLPDLPNFWPLTLTRFLKRLLNFKKMLPANKILPPHLLHDTPAIAHMHKCEVHDLGHVTEGPILLKNLLNNIDFSVDLVGFVGVEDTVDDHVADQTAHHFRLLIKKILIADVVDNLDQIVTIV